MIGFCNMYALINLKSNIADEVAEASVIQG